MRRRRRVVVGGVAALVCAAGALLATLALGQSQEPVPITISATVRVSPNRAGTPKHPQGVVIDARAHIDIARDYDPPLVQTVDVWFPKAGIYNGAKFPRCDGRTLSRKGPSGCPRGSIMGRGEGRALADQVETDPRVTIINGGGTRVYAWTVLQNPARVAAAIPGDIIRLDGSTRWSYRVHLTIPKSLQIVAGIPIVLHEAHARFGRGDWIATTSCPRDHRWRYHAEGTFSTGQVIKYDGSVGCRS